MEFMLPRVFDWPEVFHETDCFPNLTTWHAKCSENPVFAQVRKEIWDYWAEREIDGQFDSIKEVISADDKYKWKYP